MKWKRKRIVVVGCIALFVAVLASMTLYPPKRTIVVEVSGLTTAEYEAVIIVDGRCQTQTVTLPKTFTFHARDVSYRFTPMDKDTHGEITGHIYTDDGFADASCTDWSVGGHVSCPNVFGMSFGDVVVGIYSWGKDDPGAEVTTR